MSDFQANPHKKSRNEIYTVELYDIRVIRPDPIYPTFLDKACQILYYGSRREVSRNAGG